MWTNGTVTCTYLMNFNINTKIPKKIKKTPDFSNKIYMEALTFVCNLETGKKKTQTKIKHLKMGRICPISPKFALFPTKITCSHFIK